MSSTGLDTASKAASRRGSFNVRRRRAAETRFKAYGILALVAGLFFLCVLLYSIVSQGYKGFVQAEMRLNVLVDAAVLDPENTAANGEASLRETLESGMNLRRFSVIAAEALNERLGLTDPGAKKDAQALISRSAAAILRERIVADPSLMGQRVEIWLVADSDVDSYLKGIITRDLEEGRRKLSDRQLEMIDTLKSAGDIEMRFNSGLFVNPTSKRPEVAGLAVALIGSLQMMLIVLVVTLPVAIAASIYLEEFAKKNWLNDVIEVNINNLAAVPSIVFGILGLAVFINFAGLSRSSALVGGLVLSLMTLPTIIIATRASLRAVPPSIRQAALGVGASKTQAVFHHVLPLALPGILTGTIIGLAQALGETAPLLLIGMDAFVQDIPNVLNPQDPTTSMPSQIYNWAREDDRTNFDPRTSAAIMVLLAFLAVMNLTAVFLRRRFERRW